LVRKELNAVHEFLADQYAAGEENPTGYAELLVWKSAAPYQSKLSTPFFNNQIKRRVHMLLQIDHMRSGYLYRMLAIPLVFVLLCAFGLKQPSKPASLAVTPWSTGYSPADTVPASVLHSINQGDISSITVLKENGIIIIRMKNGDSLIVKINGQNDNLNLGIQSTQNANQAYSTVQVEAEFPGGSAGWAYYLNHTLKYPKYALDHEIQGDVYVQFIVNTDSTVSDLKILSSVSDALSEEAIRIIKSSKWVPATQNGVAVRAFKVQPIKYRLERQ
jgi:TonB family protein